MIKNSNCVPARMNYLEHEITVGNYTTTHFYMCGSAQKVMNANKDKKNGNFTRLQDEIFKLEKEVMDAGEATEEQKVKAKKLYNHIMMFHQAWRFRPCR